MSASLNFSVFQKATLRTLRSFVILVAIAFATLCLADWLRNPQAIGRHVAEAFAAQRFGDSGGYEWTGMHATSHFSECIGLSTAIHPAQGNAIWQTLLSPALLWRAPTPICRSLKQAIDGQPGSTYFAYSRYWHGYRLITEPMLSLMSYGMLQSLCAGLLLATGLALAWTLRPLIGALGVVVSAALILVTTDLPFVASAPTHAISLATLLLGWAFLASRAVRGSDAVALSPSAFVVGALYNFFDFLYNPDLLAFVLGWSFFMANGPTGRLSPRSALLQSVLIQMLAIAGYMAMWAAKWLLVWGGGQIFGSAIWFPAQDFGRWLGGGDQAYVPLRATAALVGEVVKLPFGGPALAACAVCFLALFLVAIRLRQMVPLACLIGLCLFPIATLEVKANHTLMHAAFTFRFVPFALVLTTMGAAGLLRAKAPPVPHETQSRQHRTTARTT